jgi:deazaflavin-dependent oxidoreductase (nitroreductase family)
MRRMRVFTARVVNPVSRRFAGWVPPFAIVVHVGRRSGRTYSTPMMVFHRGDDRVFALTYGSNVDWVANVRAAGGCVLRERGRSIDLTEPRLITDPRRRIVPLPVRLALRVLRVKDYLVLTRRHEA